MNFRMVFGDGVGDLLENGGFAGSGRGHDQTACSFAEGGYQVDDAGFDQVGGCFQAELLDGINGGEVLETDRLGVIGKRHVVDLINGSELGTVAAVGGLQGAGDEAPFAQEIALDGV